MEEAYVSLNVAKLLKLKGFDWRVGAYYQYDSEFKSNEWVLRFDDRGAANLWSDYYVLAPTQAMAMRWLRETHNIHIEPHFIVGSGKYVYNIIHSPIRFDEISSYPIVFDYYEDAVNAALETSLMNLIYDAGRILKK